MAHEELPPINITPGAIRFNTDSMKLEYFRIGMEGGATSSYAGIGTLAAGEWVQITTDSPDIQTGGTRGLYGGGDAPADQTNISYVNIDSTGNAITFGDLTDATTALSGCSSRTRGLFCGGYYPSEADIEFVTISSTGNAAAFGDLTEHRISTASVSSSTRGLTAGGRTSPSPSLSQFNTIDYVTIAQTGNSVNFGDLTVARHHLASGGSSTRGIFSGGKTPGDNSTIDFTTISTLGNCSDFGDQQTSRGMGGGVSNSVRMLIAGGYEAPLYVDTIDYITISTLGNAQDFGNLTEIKSSMDGTASPTRGVFFGGISPAGAPTAPNNRVNTIDYVQIMSLGNATDFGDMNTSSAPGSYGACSNGHGGLG